MSTDSSHLVANAGEDSRARPSSLSSTSLTVDFVYQGGRWGNAADDPLVPLLGVSNQGGFRHTGKRDCPKMVVLTTTMSEPDWPDALDLETGVLTYYGDNRKPGQELHQTRRWGNEMLRDMFARSHDELHRRQVPPILVFRNTGTYRDVVFVGLAVPGAIGVRPTESLVATWHQLAGRRFQNYRGIFTILNVATVDRAWLTDIRLGNAHTDNAPSAWIDWIKHGRYQPLQAKSNQAFRSRSEQLPQKPDDLRLIKSLVNYYKDDPIAFETCAARITQIMLPNTTSLDVTRPSRDGGRDAIGRYRIGPFSSRVEVEFAMEAKCYSLDNAVGVSHTSRLISRLRHRQFGVLVTTSYVNSQAYKEIIEDGHPILVVSALDIIHTLRQSGINTVADLLNWLDSDDSNLLSR
ncbi:restriction endonuclease [Stenotrophomonas maltophilia]|uniref:restriction endonuclease n=1 Tax=Stenotrophomonas maltophilia TaxID=40324 RepID=UPI000C15BDEB|nr:restriction endonuclease [Stenotrophomonas maltophilia]MBH1582040.1 restriction endonuclease [Stenotrophomonas maltophilia]